jgi:hypothetical protein
MNWVSTVVTPSGAASPNSEYGEPTEQRSYTAWEPIGIVSTTGEPNNLQGHHAPAQFNAFG